MSPFLYGTQRMTVKSVAVPLGEGKRRGPRLTENSRHRTGELSQASCRLHLTLQARKFGPYGCDEFLVAAEVDGAHPPAEAKPNPPITAAGVSASIARQGSLSPQRG